ncbi:Alpha/Beta hydrolase protein [Mycena filopes]|nr:Alpha/Beta hydrolase protein [Mycena filopes]
MYLNRAMDLKLSEDLEWVQCYSIYQCSRLIVRLAHRMDALYSIIRFVFQVPLDYSDPSVGTAALAVIRFPAANVSKAAYGGPILFNPGGPGGSGVDTLIQTGPEFHLVLGDQYDIVSFDPRGVSFSTPIASFFETAAERALWNAGSFPTSLNASNDALPRAWGLAHLEGQLAAQRDTSQIMKYMTSDNVVRDMLRITQKLGYDKLKYYGVSYGTVLGAMFAAMFPDKVDRILIDGVVDANAWLDANLTIAATDTDAVLQTFFDGCVTAGPSLCAFYESTANKIATRLATLTDSLRTQPIPAITTHGYALVDYSLLRMVIFNSLYMPYMYFPPLAQALASLEGGNATALYDMFQELSGDVPFECDCNTNDTAPFTANGAEAAIAVQCGDAAPVNDSIGQLTDFYQNAARTSHFVEFFVGANRLSCTGWQLHREDTFRGPVAAANTSFPLLFVANTADPVTPKAGTLNTAAGFPGSGFLLQDSPGHTSRTAPSLCTTLYFRQYFHNGTLPPPGTVCPVDVTLFGPSTTNSTSTRNSSTSTVTGAVSNVERRAEVEEERRILAALEVIGCAVRPIIRSLGRSGR